MRLIVQNKRGYNGGFATRVEPMGRTILRNAANEEYEFSGWCKLEYANKEASRMSRFFGYTIEIEMVPDDRAR